MYSEYYNFQKQGKKLQRGGKDVWSDFKVKVRKLLLLLFASV
jgi:hypothetical protein